MSPSPTDIIAMAKERENARSQYLSDHERIKRVLEGDASVFIEMLAGTEQAPIPQSRYMVVANLLLSSGNQLARRVARPPTFADRTTDPDKVSANKLAATGTKVKQFWWRENNMEQVGYKLARNLLGYSEAPIVVRPDLKKGIPCFEERDPLSCLPSEDIDWRPTPKNVIFNWRKSVGGLGVDYPAIFEAGIAARQSIDVYEYYDDEWIMVVGVKPPSEWGGQATPILLDMIPVRIGRCPVVIPKLITFGARQGDFNQLVGLLANQARLTILMLMAADRQVFPDTFISGKVIGNSINTGPDAVTMLEKDAKVARLAYNSGFQFLQEIDRVERSMRVGGGFPPQFSGETPSTLATGKGNQTLIGATVDEGVVERQSIMKMAYTEAFEIGVLMDQAGYWSASAPRRISVDKGSRSTETLTYIPKKLPRGVTRLEYGLLSAADASSVTVMLGQKVGTKELSLQDSRELDPFCQDPDLTAERVLNETLDQFLLEQIHQKVLAGEYDPRTLAKIKKLVRAGNELEDAVDKALGPDAMGALQQQMAAGAAPAPEALAAQGGQRGPAPSIDQLLGGLLGRPMPGGAPQPAGAAA